MDTNFSKSHEEMQLERIILADNDLPTAKADCVISDLADQLTTLNEKYANCVRQLTEAHARIDRFEAAPKGWWHKEVEELKQQLAAAIAACKAKDEALELIALDDCCTSPAPIAQEALAIQPDDSALKAWLGEPVAWEFTDTFGTHYTEDRRDWMDTSGIESVTPLYSPKGLK